MSVLVECSMGELNGERKTLFPLFQKGPTTLNEPPNVPNENPDEFSSERSQEDPPQSDVLGRYSGQGGRQSKMARDLDHTTTNTLKESHAQASLLDVDPNESRKKRRKTTPIESESKLDTTENDSVDGRAGTPPQREALGTNGATSLPQKSALDALSDKSSKKRQNNSLLQQTRPAQQDPGIKKAEGDNAVQSQTIQQVAGLPIEISNINPLPLKPDLPAGELSSSNTTTISNPPSILTVEPKPTKLLKFNPKTGTIGSPPKPRQLQDLPNSSLGIGVIEDLSRPSVKRKKPKKSGPRSSENGTLNPFPSVGTPLENSLSGIDSDSPLRGSAGSVVDAHLSTVIPATISNGDSDTTSGKVLAFHPSINKLDSIEALAQESPSSIAGTENPQEFKPVSTIISIENPKTKPKKVIYFNAATGTFGSPPVKQTNTVAGTSSKKVKHSKQARSLLVVIHYSKSIENQPRIRDDVVSLNPKLFVSQNEPEQRKTILSARFSGHSIIFSRTAVSSSLSHPIMIENEKTIPEKKSLSSSTRLSLGQRISRILNSEERFEFPPAKATMSKSSNPTRRLVLGFNTSSQNTRNSSDTVPEIIDLTGPSLKPILWPIKSTVGPLKDTMTNQASSRFEPRSPTRRKGVENLGESAKVLKFPGAMEPSWPCKGMIHTNPDLTAFHCQNISQIELPDLKSMNGKWKTHAVAIADDEDIMQFISSRLNIDEVMKSIREVNLDKFPPVPSCIRLPEKRHETGPGIQALVRVKLHSPMPSTDQGSDTDDEIKTPNNRVLNRIHPGLAKLYASIPTNPPALDRGQCETQTWAQKYAPEKADEVLQPGPEASLLKEWLVSQTVNSVESSGSSAKHPAPKKRKRKPAKQDDPFIVYSDEDDSEEVKNNNTILISGPHGSGKTAAIYAVAKELGFEIFEINPGSRRSGRDILAKIGDMIGNHLVQGVKELPQVDGIAEDRRAEFENDLKTGRQGTLNGFFATKPSKPKSDNQKPAQTTAKVSIATTQTSSLIQKKQITLGGTVNAKAPPKEQKQSLILIEEADLIYKQDSQFWSTIEKLQDISRRPIILTCNDDNDIPLCRDTLHSILRFEPPPIDLAVDHMLLIAASEGHLIPREAVKTLYEGRGLDLRASLTELNFWCQFAVGDVNRGLGWFYPRAYGREDVDKNGHAIRVVSEGTYQNGMGWLCQDNLESHAQSLNTEDERLHEDCEAIGLDLGDWEKTLKVNSWPDQIQLTPNTSSGQLSALRSFSEFTDNMSDADILSGGLFGLPDQISLDATQPSLWDSDCEEYPILYHVNNAPETHILHAPEAMQYSTTRKDIGIFARSRGRNILQANFLQQDLNYVTESHIMKLMCRQAMSPDPWLSQEDLTAAFKPFRSPDTMNQKVDNLQFKRNQRILIEDLAPYVRGIVAYDARLQKERESISNLLSEGGRPGKRQRTTRSAFSAMAGGPRDRTRKERWFSEIPDLNSIYVLRTAGENWFQAAMELEAEQQKQLIDVIEEEVEMES